MIDKRREWNNDMMDPDWTPTPQSAFKEFMNRKKVEYMNTHPGMFGTVHVTDWAEEYLKPLESQLSQARQLIEADNAALKKSQSLVKRQAELLETAEGLMLYFKLDNPGTMGEVWLAEFKALKDLEALGETTSSTEST